MADRRKLWMVIAAIALAGSAMALFWYTDEDSGTDGGGGESGGPQDSGGQSSDDDPSGKAPAEDAPPSEKEPEPEPGIALPDVVEQQIPGNPAVGSEDEAQDILDEVEDEIGLGDGSELEVQGSTDDGLGNSYYQVQQKYKGIDVYGAVSVLEAENGQAGQLYGTWVQDLDMDVEPVFDAVTALRMALTGMGVPESRGIELVGDDPRLIIMITDQGAILCWMFQAGMTEPVTPVETFAVDAQTPRIIGREAIMRQ